jgi:DNA invertase Pin-like site-specific DNA recombinase
LRSSPGSPVNPKPAFSYARFSRPEQVRGDSLRRQFEATRAYCGRNGLVLDDSLNLRDLGVSAFRGKNAGQGALGAFTSAVASGRVPRGATLIVESLDRLSRKTSYRQSSVNRQDLHR